MKRKWRDLKLQTKFIMIFLFTSLAICVGNLLALRIMQQAYNQELYHKSTQLMTLFAENVQGNLDRVTYDSENMISDSKLQECLSEILRKEESLEKWYDATVQIGDRINDFRFYSQDIDYVYLIDSYGKKYGRFDVELNVPENYLEQMIAAAKHAEGREAWIFLPEMSDSLVLVRDIREVRNFTFRSLGTLIIKVDFEAIVKRTSKVLEDAGTEMMVAVYHQAIW